jgi:LacI family transcriptional regulator
MRLPSVAILVDTSRSYGRDIVRGIRRYVAEHGPWSL